MIFKRIKDIFRARKVEDEGGKIDYEVEDLRKSYFLDYDLKTWEVTEEAVYTWDNGVKDLEFKIETGKEVLYLNYCKNMEPKTSVYWKGNYKKLPKHVRTNIQSNQPIPQEFEMDGVNYFVSDSGVARVTGTEESYEMQNWLFMDENDQTYLSINKYGPMSFEMYIGKPIKEIEVSNILPR